MIIRKRHTFFVLFLLFIINKVLADEAVIAGKATYLERMALPTNALFEATLEDVSLMDAPSVTLGRAVVSPVGQLPIAFEILYNTEDLKKGHHYNVRARITVNGNLLFVTNTVNMVLNGKDDSKLQLLMKRIQRSSKKEKDAAVPFSNYSVMTAQTIEPKVLMLGLYQYMADAAFFKECITGLKLPVLFEKDNAALERAYNKDKKEAGALLKVHIEGKIVHRPKMEGEEMQAHLLVERFVKTMPNETCEI